MTTRHDLEHLFDDVLADPERPASIIAYEEQQAAGEFFADAMQEALGRSGPRRPDLARLRSEITGQFIAEGGSR